MELEGFGNLFIIESNQLILSGWIQELEEEKNTSIEEQEQK